MTREEAWIDLECCLFDKINAAVQLAELVVAAAGVGKDLHAVEAHENVGAMTNVSSPVKSRSFTYLAGVKSSSHTSTPMQVSSVLTTQSPKGTVA